MRTLTPLHRVTGGGPVHNRDSWVQTGKESENIELSNIDQEEGTPTWENSAGDLTPIEEDGLLDIPEDQVRYPHPAIPPC